jgi:hypothetical protein
MGDQPAFLLDAEGLMYVARFERLGSRKDGDRVYTEIVVSQRKFDGTRYERTFGYDQVDLDSGSQTDISLAVTELTAGDQVALRLNQMVSRAKGTIWSKLQSVEVLPPARSGAASVTSLPNGTNPHGGAIPKPDGVKAQAS